MRWLIYGESWRGAMPYSAKRALEALGHETIVLDPTQHFFSHKIRNKGGMLLNRLLFRYVARELNRAILMLLQNERFDVVLIFKGSHIWPETVQTARKRCEWVINWNWDDFFNPVRYHRSPYIAATFKEYDLILTSRYHLIKEYLERGARRVERMDFCVDPSVHYPIPELCCRYDVAFVGSWSTRREHIISSLHDCTVGIWGASWKHASKSFLRLPSVHMGSGPAECENMSRALCSSKIGLNVLTLENRDLINLRNYEIPACGAFQLCERTEAVKELFEEGKEVECYGSVDELADKLRFYCENEEKRKAVARAGHLKVMKGGHTYQDRMQSLVKLLEAS